MANVRCIHESSDRLFSFEQSEVIARFLQVFAFMFQHLSQLISEASVVTNLPW